MNSVTTEESILPVFRAIISLSKEVADDTD